MSAKKMTDKQFIECQLSELAGCFCTIIKELDLKSTQFFDLVEIHHPTGTRWIPYNHPNLRYTLEEIRKDTC